MLAMFCLRLALGMLAALLLLSPKQMHPRFFRTHFLIALGLCLVSTVMSWGTAAGWLSVIAAILALLGAVVWVFERAPAGWTLLALTAVAIITSLVATQLPAAAVSDGTSVDAGPSLWLAVRVADNVTSAAVLGLAMTAMLVGHSYLISPGLAIRPLIHELAALGVALLLRVAVAGTALCFWTAEHNLTNLNDETVLWLPVRWLIGLIGPLGFGWMAYQTARIRSTQSATGILYVVVILAFLGELTSLLLLRNTRLPL